MLILLLKSAHLLAVVLFLGTGAGSAWYKLRAARSRNVEVIAWCDAEVVLADWIFTVPSGVILPVTGLALVHLYRLPLATPWVWQGIAGYVIAGLTWLPAAFLQQRMRMLSARARDEKQSLPASWHAMQRVWALLGVPSFSATLAAVWMMVSKQALLK